ncbi:MAG: aminoglycoside phosphotransferase family protein [Myxococcota bacterium]|nr:aminoglycoside phosphotransferase family protein [Myxococcota bacterium]
MLEVVMQAEEALLHWGRYPEPRWLEDGGLINTTWLVGSPPSAVLQRVNPIFAPTIHLDIQAVTGRLEQMGVLSPRLLPTLGGELWVPDTEGCWRLQEFVPGLTLHALETLSQAREAGILVGRFHSALSGWDHVFGAPRRNIHDTPARMVELEKALAQNGDHVLAGEVLPLGRAILDAWRRWEGPEDAPDRYTHGDLKVSNLRFDEQGACGRCLIDLDTLGTMPLALEMGDAWRSWCNPAGEDDPDSVHFEVPLFEASVTGWLGTAPTLTRGERDGLVPAIERICLELSSRFCRDALLNSYFREDRKRFPEAGRHNLRRARAQYALAESARSARADCQAIVQQVLG